MKATAKICVLGGGNSPERDVSLRSSTAVAVALRHAGYHVGQLDPSQLSHEQLVMRLHEFDVTFPVLHGAGGEDGTIQAFLEQNGIAYVGANAKVSALCFDKAAYKEAIVKLGFTTPRSETVTYATFQNSELTQNPYVLKPVNGGSSVDTFIFRDLLTADLSSVPKAFETYGSMLLEELIEGPEITVGVVGDEALPVIEIIPPADAEFDYENKYNGRTQELCPPQHIDQNLQRTAQDIALQIHRKLGIDDLSRTDILIRSSDQKLFVLETNTLPGMTEQSLLPKAAAVAGHSMPEMCSMLVEAAYAHQHHG